MSDYNDFKFWESERRIECSDYEPSSKIVSMKVVKIEKEAKEEAKEIKYKTILKKWSNTQKRWEDERRGKKEKTSMYNSFEERYNAALACELQKTGSLYSKDYKNIFYKIKKSWNSLDVMDSECYVKPMFLNYFKFKFNKKKEEELHELSA